jgi:hypothetical protein
MTVMFGRQAITNTTIPAKSVPKAIKPTRDNLATISRRFRSLLRFQL